MSDVSNKNSLHQTTWNYMHQQHQHLYAEMPLTVSAHLLLHRSFVYSVNVINYKMNASFRVVTTVIQTYGTNSQNEIHANAEKKHEHSQSTCSSFQIRLWQLTNAMFIRCRFFKPIGSLINWDIFCVFDFLSLKNADLCVKNE